MRIRRATAEDLQQLYEFNHRMYPERLNYKEIIDFWVSKTPDAISDIIVVADDDGKIRGQQFFSSMSYYRDGVETNGVWAFDLIVDEELRAGSQGFSLMWKCKKEHPNTMSSGSNDVSLAINMKIGNKHVGNLKKFVGMANPLWLFTSVWRGNIASRKFPRVLKTSGAIYRKIDNPEDIPTRKRSYNPLFLEYSRTKEFMAWRYFSRLHDYALYKRDANDDYFVVRTIVRNHVTSLVLVDYRCQLSDDSDMNEIFRAFRGLASKLKLSILIVGSSVAVVDRVCEHHHLKAIGRDRPVLGMIDCDNPEKVREERNFVLLTLADTDGEVTW